MHGLVILFIACVLAGAILHDRRDYWRAIRWGDSRALGPVSQLPNLEDWHARFDLALDLGADHDAAAYYADKGRLTGITARQAQTILHETMRIYSS